MFRSLITRVWLCFAAVFCFSDHITLNNDDRLTGTIVKSDGKVLTVKTDGFNYLETRPSRFV